MKRKKFWKKVEEWLDSPFTHGELVFIGIILFSVYTVQGGIR